MKKKLFLIIGAGLVVLLIAVAVVAGFFLGDVVKAGMNTVGPKVTQTAFSVDSVSVHPFLGAVSLNNFVIGNPEGYKAPSAISVGKTSVSVVPSSVLADKIIVKSIEVHDPEITFEGNPLGANNLKKILDNVNAFTGTGSPADTNAPAAGAAKPAKKLQVDDFLISGAKVHVSLTGLVNKELNLTLPDIHLTNLGTGSEGITPVELTKEVLNKVIHETLAAVVNAAGDLGKGVENLGKGAGKTATEDVNKITKGLGGLFGK